jgi:hypothetical protein
MINVIGLNGIEVYRPSRALRALYFFRRLFGRTTKTNTFFCQSGERMLLVYHWEGTNEIIWSVGFTPETAIKMAEELVEYANRERPTRFPFPQDGVHV